MAYTNFSELKTELTTKMDKALDVLKRDLSGLRTGRASVNLLDNIMVMAYGTPTPINQVASISTPEARLICVSVWDKSLAPAVEKAIRDSDLGLNPASDGTLVRIPIPTLTEERRKELSKVASNYAEQTKVSIRNVRRDGMEAVKSMEKEKLISEDDRKSYEEEIQKLTDTFVSEVEKHFNEKQKDIMTI
jgi:ribosome recycling factor